MKWINTINFWWVFKFYFPITIYIQHYFDFKVYSIAITQSYFSVFPLIFLFFKKRFYLFLFRVRGREKERERNINVWLSLTCPLLGTWPTTQACVLTGNRTGGPLVRRPVLNSLSHTGPGPTGIASIHLTTFVVTIILLTICPMLYYRCPWLLCN